MNKEIRKELTRIKHEIEKQRIDYSEIHFLQSNKQAVLEYGDIVLAQWADISEEEWNNQKLNQYTLEVKEVREFEEVLVYQNHFSGSDENALAEFDKMEKEYKDGNDTIYAIYLYKGANCIKSNY